MDRKRTTLEACQRVVVLHQGALGDFLLALSLVQPAAKQLNNPLIIAISGNPVAKLAAGRSVITSRQSPEETNLHTLFGDSPPKSEIWAEILQDADLVISFLGAPDSHVHNRLSHVSEAKIISIDPRPMDETQAKRIHITHQWWQDIRKQEPRFPKPMPPVISRTIYQSGNNTSKSSHENVAFSSNKDETSLPIIIHPGSGGREKCWPWKRFFQLADELGRSCNISWMLGPAELERTPEVNRSLRRRCDSSPGEALIVEENLAIAAFFLCRAGLYIGNDGGMTHLAAALGLETVAIFGPTDPYVWRPLGNHVHIAATSTVGDSIDKISVEQVLEVCQPLLY